MRAARLPTDTLAQAASVSKLITAPPRQGAKDTGHDFNDKVAPFLPKCWKRGPGVNGLTFGDIAAHNSGFSDGETEKAVPDGNLARRVRKTFEMGQVKTPKRGDYQNYNYAVFRYLIPLVAKREKALGIFKKFDCKDTALLNEQISVLFNEDLDMLRLGGLTPGKGRSFLPQEGLLAEYDWQDRKATGGKPNEEGPYRGGAAISRCRPVGAGKFWRRSIPARSCP